MIYIPNSNHDPALNLAMEEYILSASGIKDAVLFFYINAPSIIIGRHQNTLDEINVGFVRKNGIRIVRRCSGGGAVYHDFGNLNYSLICPGDPKTSGDFSSLLIPILEALRALGLPAVLGGRNDLLLNGAKFSGNAYYHNRCGSVTHGTLLYDSDLQVLSQALRPDPHKLQAKGISSVRSRVCCIKDFLPEVGSIEALEEAIVRYFSSRGDLTRASFSETDRQAFEALADTKYRNDLWTYGESPAFSLRRLVRQPGGWIDFRADIRGNTVNHARFFGDYFCVREISELENTLQGKTWDPERITETLADAGWENYFPGYPLKDFVEELFSGKADA